jgi:16S rRNA (guanine527-N7)-methyltransferase
MSGVSASAELPAAMAADRERALRLTPVSRETLDRLDRYVALLLQWQQHTNLVARSTIPHLWTRHVADSLQLLDLAPQARTWLDLGSGAGFPGLVLACALEERAETAVELVESIGKKARFLREAIKLCGVRAVVHAERIEQFVPRCTVVPEIVTARALAPLDVLFGWIAPLVEKGAQALLLKGQDVEAELTRASKCWKVEATLVPSKTSRDGRIVMVRALHKLPDGSAGRDGLKHVRYR